MRTFFPSSLYRLMFFLSSFIGLSSFLPPLPAYLLYMLAFILVFLPAHFFLSLLTYFPFLCHEYLLSFQTILLSIISFYSTCVPSFFSPYLLTFFNFSCMRIFFPSSLNLYLLFFLPTWLPSFYSPYLLTFFPFSLLAYLLSFFRTCLPSFLPTCSNLLSFFCTYLPSFFLAYLPSFFTPFHTFLLANLLSSFLDFFYLSFLVC